MALEPVWLDPDEMQSRLGLTLTGASLVSLKAIMAGVEAAIANTIGSPVITTTLNLWLPSTGTDIIVLPQRPVNIGYTFQVYLCQEAYNVATATLLTYQTDYDIDGQPSQVWGGGTYRGSAILRRLRGYWPGAWGRLPTRLASRIVQQSAMVRVTNLVVGWDIGDIPLSLFEAGYSESAVRYFQRTRGQVYQSESLNGYQYSLGSASMALQATMAPIPGFASDTARTLLTPYVDLPTNY